MRIPESTRRSVLGRLEHRAKERWPALAGINVRYRGSFAYVDGIMDNGERMPLCRLRYGESASSWGFAIYLASGNRYEDSLLPSGNLAGSPEEALDCACGLYLSDPSAWLG